MNSTSTTTTISSRVPKRVLVTGAEGALGSEVVERFLASGCDVIGTYHPKASPGQRRENLEWLEADLSSPGSVRFLATQGLSKNRPVEGLIHCAGGFRYRILEESTDEEIDFLINSNLRSAILLLREFLPAMKAQNFGRVVLISSRSTLQAPAGMGVYAAAKAGLNMLVSSVGEEVKSYDINLNAVLPTMIDTPANRRDMPSADFTKWVRREELAEIIFSLTQPLCRPIHGALVPVAGRL